MTFFKLLVQTNVGRGALILRHKLEVYISRISHTEMDHSNSAKLSISVGNSIKTTPTLPLNHNVVCNKWVFTIEQKRLIKVLDRYKARLVA
jgi:hypothetical protein